MRNKLSHYFTYAWRRKPYVAFEINFEAKSPIILKRNLGKKNKIKIVRYFQSYKCHIQM